jgi:tetratricopeptide (TPR) repeat protein
MKKKLLLFLFSILTVSVFGQSATAMYREAVALAQQHDYIRSNQQLDQIIERYPSRLYDLAGAYLLKSENSLALRQFTDAFLSNEKSLDIQQGLGSDELALNYLQDGRIYAKMGDLAKAVAHYRKALDQAFYSSNLLADIYIEMADVFLQLERYRLALNHADQALAIFQIEGSEDDGIWGKAYLQMAQALLELERVEEAQSAIQAAIKLLGTTDSHRLLLGQCYALQSTRLGGSARNQAIQNAFRSWKPLLEDKNPVAAQAALQLAIHHGDAKLKAGIGAFDMALGAILPQDPSDAKPSDIDNTFPSGGSLYALGLAYEALSTNKPSLARMAVRAFETYLPLHPHQTPHLLQDRSWRKIYLAAIELALANENKAEAFDYANRLKQAHAFAGRVAPLWLEGQYPASLQQQVQAVAKAQALFQLQPKEKTAEVQYIQAQQDLSAAISALTGMEAQLFTLRTPLGLAALQKGLSKDQAMIHYVADDEKAWGFVIRFNQSHAVALQVDQLPIFATALQATTTSAYQDIAFAWYKAIFAPLQDALDGVDKIHIILDPALEIIPFEALVDKKRSTNSFRRLHYLLDSYGFSYSFTAHPLAAPALPEALTYFTPKVGNTAIPEAVESYFDTNFQLLPVLHKMAPDGWELITHEELSLETAITRQLFKKDASVVMLADSAATIAALQKALATPANLHIAGPAYAQSSLSPYFGLFGKTREGAVQATASDLYRQRSKATLVSFAQFYSDDAGSMVALTDHFQETGVGYVILPMQTGEGDHFWPMFYKYMLREKTGTKAMHRAKQKLQNKSKTAAPKYWAGYLIFR